MHIFKSVLCVLVVFTISGCSKSPDPASLSLPVSTAKKNEIIEKLQIELKKLDTKADKISDLEQLEPMLKQYSDLKSKLDLAEKLPEATPKLELANQMANKAVFENFKGQEACLFVDATKDIGFDARKLDKAQTLAFLSDLVIRDKLTLIVRGKDDRLDRATEVTLSTPPTQLTPAPENYKYSQFSLVVNGFWPDGVAETISPENLNKFGKGVGSARFIDASFSCYTVTNKDKLVKPLKHVSTITGNSEGQKIHTFFIPVFESESSEKSLAEFHNNIVKDLTNNYSAKSFIFSRYVEQDGYDSARKSTSFRGVVKKREAYYGVDIQVMENLTSGEVTPLRAE